METPITHNTTNLRSVLKDEHGLVIPRQCDEFLVRCVQQKDGNMQSAIKLILAYCDAIGNLRNWNATLLPSLGVEVCKTGIALPLKLRDPCGRYIVIFRPGLWDPEKVNFEQAVAFMWMLLQYIGTQLVEVQQHGFVTIADFSDFKMYQHWAIKPWKLLSLGMWAHNGVVGRIKSINIVNHPKIVGITFQGIRPILSKKLKERVIFHDNVDNLVKDVGEEYLPIFLGGMLDEGECRDVSMLEGFFNSDQYFRDMMDTGVPSI